MSETPRLLMSRNPMKTEVYELDPDEKVGCYFCMQEPWSQAKEYGRGEAFLCGADHAPYDGNANYVCKIHLEDNVDIQDPIPLASHQLPDSLKGPRMNTQPLHDTHTDLIKAVEGLGVPRARAVPVTLVSFDDKIQSQLIIFDETQYTRFEVAKRLRKAAEFLEKHKGE